jgi:hypothetical protein
MIPIFYVICPTRQACVENPPDAVSPEHPDPFNVTNRDDCGIIFDYDDEEVTSDGTQATA